MSQSMAAYSVESPVKLEHFSVLQHILLLPFAHSLSHLIIRILTDNRLVFAQSQFARLIRGHCECGQKCRPCGESNLRCYIVGCHTDQRCAVSIGDHNTQNSIYPRNEQIIQVTMSMDNLLGYVSLYYRLLTLNTLL